MITAARTAVGAASEKAQTPVQAVMTPALVPPALIAAKHKADGALERAHASRLSLSARLRYHPARVPDTAWWDWISALLFACGMARGRSAVEADLAALAPGGAAKEGCVCAAGSAAALLDAYLSAMALPTRSAAVVVGPVDPALLPVLAAHRLQVTHCDAAPTELPPHTKLVVASTPFGAAVPWIASLHGVARKAGAPLWVHHLQGAPRGGRCGDVDVQSFDWDDAPTAGYVAIATFTRALDAKATATVLARQPQETRTATLVRVLRLGAAMCFGDPVSYAALAAVCRRLSVEPSAVLGSIAGRCAPHSPQPATAWLALLCRRLRTSATADAALRHRESFWDVVSRLPASVEVLNCPGDCTDGACRDLVLHVANPAAVARAARREGFEALLGTRPVVAATGRDAAVQRHTVTVALNPMMADPHRHRLLRLLRDLPAAVVGSPDPAHAAQVKALGGHRYQRPAASTLLQRRRPFEEPMSALVSVTLSPALAFALSKL